MYNRTITVNGNRFDFYNTFFRNSRNWGHKTELHINDRVVTKNKCIYLNRTWEVYPYQSCMQDCVYNLLDIRRQEIESDFRNKNNIKRLTSEKRVTLDVIITKDNEIKDLNKLLKELR